LAELVPSVALIILFAWWWARNLERLATTADVSGPSRPVGLGDAAATPTLFPPWARFLPPNRVGAVAAKDLRYLWREPAQRAQRLSITVVALVAVGWLAVRAGTRDPRMVLASAAFLWWVSLGSLNQFAGDRQAYWMNAVAAGDARDDLIGKNIASAAAAAPIYAAVLVAAAAITGGWAYVPLALCLAVGTFGIVLGTGNVVSVRLAQPLPDSRTNPWAGRTGRGCGTAAVMFGVGWLNLALLVPLAAVVTVGLFVSRPVLFLAAAFAIAYGAGAYLLGLHIASGWLRGHQAELLANLSPSKSD
jgi:ABC-2 type transport system permease protein